MQARTHPLLDHFPLIAAASVRIRPACKTPLLVMATAAAQNKLVAGRAIGGTS